MPKKYLALTACVMILVIFGGVLILRNDFIRSKSEPLPDSGINPIEQEADDRANAILDERKKMDETVWAKEVKAQEYEEVFVELWDRLLKSKDMLDTLSGFGFGKLVAGTPGSPKEHAYGITLTPLSQSPKDMTGGDLQSLAADLKKKRIRLTMTEWHHKKFDLFEDGTAASTLSMTLYLEQAAEQNRWVVNGDLKVKWPVRTPGKSLVPELLDATQLTLAHRQGPPGFSEIPVKNFGENLEIPAGGSLVVYDLNRDGLEEIIFPARNEVYWNRGEFRFERAPLLSHAGLPADQPLVSNGAALLADFSGDGYPDLVLAGRTNAIVMYEGGPQGKFPSPGKVIFQDARITNPSCLTSGDINGDGTLDLWLAQYRPAYERGQMPTPYFDANDGYPGFLLLNEGRGKFSEATAVSGLQEKRYRRTYSASFVDLDDDQDLDFMVVSDYSGVDVYRNDGKGKFEDITGTAVDERANFGMSHAFADFNRDGKLDFLVTGMSSTTARRLEHMQLGREEFPDHQKMRMPMGYGNRLYLRQSDGNYRMPAWRDTVARSGWSWGCAAFDFANDGLIDLYIANGHISGETTKDYCTRFWTQDIYTGSPKADLSFAKVMREEMRTTRDWSWNGYEKKALFLAAPGDRYLNSSFLLGVGFEFDGRHVVSSDLDNDGRQDLMIVELKNSGRSNPYQILRVIKNQFDSKNNWIGLRFQESPGGSTVGARVVLKTSEGTFADCIANGDSFDSQHPLTIHFGLGSTTKVEEAQIFWPNGRKSVIPSPSINRYHLVQAPL